VVPRAPRLRTSGVLPRPACTSCSSFGWLLGSAGTSCRGPHVFGPLVRSLGLPALPCSAPPWHLRLVLLGFGWPISWRCSRSGASLLRGSFALLSPPTLPSITRPGYYLSCQGRPTSAAEATHTSASGCLGDLPCAACHVGAGAPDPFVASASGRVGAPASSSSSGAATPPTLRLCWLPRRRGVQPGATVPWHTAGRREAAHGSRRFGQLWPGTFSPSRPALP